MREILYPITRLIVKGITKSIENLLRYYKPQADQALNDVLSMFYAALKHDLITLNDRVYTFHDEYNPPYINLDYDLSRMKIVTGLKPQFQLTTDYHVNLPLILYSYVIDELGMLIHGRKVKTVIKLIKRKQEIYEQQILQRLKEICQIPENINYPRLRNKNRILAKLQPFVETVIAKQNHILFAIYSNKLQYGGPQIKTITILSDSYKIHNTRYKIGNNLANFLYELIYQIFKIMQPRESDRRQYYADILNEER